MVEYGSVLIPFSGGVDSSFLLKVSVDFLGPDKSWRLLLNPKHERKEAKKFATELGVERRIIQSSEIANQKFRGNPPDRCYFCKKELFQDLKNFAGREGYNKVLDGTILDDTRGGHRPGLEAAEELGIVSPLKESGLTKDDMRKYSKEVGLQTWDKPSFACLASRFPYGSEITEEKLEKWAKQKTIYSSVA